MKRKNYSDFKLSIERYPEPTLMTTGSKVGCPILQIKMGDKIKLTNKQLFDYIETEYSLIDMVVFTDDDDPTDYADEIWSFIKYSKSIHKNTAYRDRWWGMVTHGKRYVEKLLYELDDILIDVLTPSSGSETPPEFISWCNEDPNIKNKVQFRITIGANAQDISFARMEVPKLGTLRCPITLQPLYWNKKEINKEMEIAQTLQNTSSFEKNYTQPTGWKSYSHFVDEFIDTVRYPYIRILPDLVKVLNIKK